MTRQDGYLRKPDNEAARAATKITTRMLSASDANARDALKPERDRLMALVRAQGGADALVLALAARLEALETRLAALERAGNKA